MMKNAIRVISAVLLFLSALQLANILTYDRRSGTAADPASPAAPVFSSSGTQGKTLLVDMTVESSGLEGLSDREMRDQRLDWLLFAAVSGLVKNVEDYSAILYDQPLLRQGFMRPTGSYEFGATRSRVVGNDMILALVPASVSQMQRIDDLAYIADMHRKNLGKPFKHMTVVEYTLDGDQATLRRLEDISYADLFSSAFGYYENQVSSLAQLQAFMDSMDDLTSASMRPQGLVLGGRKLHSSPYRSIAPELVATVWQAEQDLQSTRIAWEHYEKDKIRDFDDKWKPPLSDSQMAEAKTEAAELIRAINHEKKQRGIKPGIGFSLDPQVDFEQLNRAFHEWAGFLLYLQIVPIEVLQQVDEGLAAENLAPYTQFMSERRNANDAISARLLFELMDEATFQVARYDGNLQGTEVGMVLFYTDLLAKLWTIDFVRSSPRHSSMADFIDDPSVRVSRVYDAERDELSQARIWFGPALGGIQFADLNNDLHFARNATRIFSAGSNPEDPGKETQTSAFLAAAIEWWNDHYEEVAQLEPEYQRLNQIMKWSAVTAWLAARGQSDKLAFLNAVTVDKSARFPEWAERNPQLQFRQWREVAFHTESPKGVLTESLPKLAGPVTAGGVSLVSRDAARRGAVTEYVPALLRRSDLDYNKAGIGGKSLVTLDEISIVLRSAPNGIAEVTAKAKGGTKLRSSDAQLAETGIRRTVAQFPDRLVLETATSESRLGQLSIKPKENGFTLGWQAHELSLARTLARDLSASATPEKVLLADARVQNIVALGQPGEYVVQMRGSSQWIMLAPEKAPRIDIDPNWQVRAALPADANAQVMQAAVKNGDSLDSLIPSGGHLAAESMPDGKLLMRVAMGEPDPGAHILRVEIPSGKLEGWASPDGRLLFRAPDGANAILTTSRLRQPDLAAIRSALDEGLPSFVLGTADKLAADIRRRDYQSVALRISRDHVAAHGVMRRQLADDLASNANVIRNGPLPDALHAIDILVDTYGPVPELLLRRGLVQLRRGNLDAATAALESGRRPLADRASFFDEINALRRNAAEPQNSLSRFMLIADQYQAEAQGIPTAYKLGPKVRGSELEVDMTLREWPQEALKPDQLKTAASGIVYREKSASLDKIDWSAPLDQVLTQVVTSNLGDIVRVPRGRVADYRPAAILSPENKEFIATRQIYPGLTARPLQTCVSTSDARACVLDENGESADGRDVYLVVSK